MRLSRFCLFLLLLIPITAISQSTRTPRPPGVIEADKRSNEPLDPPTEARNLQINMEKVNAETQELRQLADGLPPRIEQVGKGEIPKDLAENLKKIEKLAKHLRGEITP